MSGASHFRTPWLLDDDPPVKYIGYSQCLVINKKSPELDKFCKSKTYPNFS
jgi:hypothetical protein